MPQLTEIIAIIKRIEIFHLISKRKVKLFPFALIVYWPFREPRAEINLSLPFADVVKKWKEILQHFPAASNKKRSRGVDTSHRSRAQGKRETKRERRDPPNGTENVCAAINSSDEEMKK